MAIEIVTQDTAQTLRQLRAVTEAEAIMSHGIERTRTKNKAARQHASAVQCVIEHLEHFGVLVVGATGRAPRMPKETLRFHAEEIVKAVTAIKLGRDL